MTDPDLSTLIACSINVAQKAYVPYSHFPVGAALRTNDGTVFSGCNVENAAYPSGICAERTALVKAVSEGYRLFDIIVVASVAGGSPCGQCRQMLYEFAPDLRVVLVDFDGAIHHDLTLRTLLPLGFGPESLPHP